MKPDLTTIHIRGERFLWIPEEAREAISRAVLPLCGVEEGVGILETDVSTPEVREGR
jgi:hypothetical protein